MKKTFYEFFAGGGMAHAGLGRGWCCLFANDFSEKKANSYAANWGDRALHVGDVALIEPAHLPDQADLAWASFPCQDLSLAGNGAGLDGARSGTFWAFMKIMDCLRVQGRKPRIIALENVYGAITSHEGKDFEAMIKTVAAQGYCLGAMVIDAIHFVPQSRPRLFIVAVDDRLQIPDACFNETPNPAWHPAAMIKAYNQLSKKLKNKWIWWSPPVPKKSLKTLDDIIEKNPQGINWHTPEETQKLMAMMSPLNRRKVIQAQEEGNLKVGALYRRTRDGIQRAEVRFDGVSGCLRTPGGGSSRQTILIVDGSAVRSRLLSPREAARLMGLKDSYLLPGRYNDAYHLAGDGVVVPVVSHLAKHIFDVVIEKNLAVVPFAKVA
ncbi:MAG: DNA cytosine methyltransferase [Burkholderiaceae bacterium]|nr:DNA cytosine methyltransferase [Burkholderiaceae bacterium]